MKRYVFIFLLIISNLYGQNDILNFSSNELKQIYPSTNFLYRKDSIFIKNSKKDIKEKKNILRSNLLEHISQNISVDVYSINKYSISDNNNNFSDNFTSETTIKSDIEITNIELEEYNYNKRTKYLTGIIIIDKRKLAETSLIKSNKNMELIIAQLNNKNVVDIDNIEDMYKKCLIWFKVSLILNPNSPNIKKFDTLNNEYYRLISIIKNTNPEIKLQNDIAEIKKYQNSKNFISAIKLCENSLSTRPYNQSLLKLKEDIRNDFELFTIQRSNYYLKDNNKQQAINECNLFLSYFYDSEEVILIKNKIEIDIFNDISKDIKWNIEQNRITQAQYSLNSLEKIKYVNIDKFLELKSLVFSYSKKEDFKEIKSMFNKKEYKGTYNRVTILENKYGKDEFLTNIKIKTEHKLYIIDKKEFKKTKPKLFTIAPQVDMNGEYYYLDKLNDFDLEQSFYLSYSLSINRKFEYKLDDINTDNCSFGIKLRYLDFNNNFNRTGSGFQIGFSMILPEYMFYEFGYHFNSVNPYYIASGLNIPLSNSLFIQMGVQTYTDFIKPVEVQGLLGIQYRFDVIRRLTKSEKTMLKNKRI